MPLRGIRNDENRAESVDDGNGGGRRVRGRRTLDPLSGDEACHRFVSRLLAVAPIDDRSLADPSPRLAP